MNLTKQDLLDLLMLLSAFESWGFSTKTPFPDYLHGRLSDCIERFSEALIENNK